MNFKHILTGAAAAIALAGCNGSNNVTAPTVPTTSPSAGTKYIQFEVLSRPAVKELFETFVNHQVTNGVEPYNDPTLQSSIVGFSGVFRNQATANALGSILYPNEYLVDLTQSGPASYLGAETGGATGGKFGGRAIGDNVIDISLGAVFGNTLAQLNVVPDDGQENNCLTSQHVSQNPTQAQTGTFPYLSPPH